MCDNKCDAILNSRILANHFIELCKDFLPPYRENNVWMNRKKAQINNDIIFLLIQIVRLIGENKIDVETFKNELKKIMDHNIIHVEILWYLEFFKIMNLMEFIQFHECHNNEEIIYHIAQKVFENVLDWQGKTSEIRKRVLLDYFRTILECLKYDNKNNKASFFQVQLSLILKNLRLYYSSEGNYDVERHLEILHLNELCNNEELDCELVKLFFQQILMELLECSPCTIKSTIKKQEKLRNNVNDKKIYQFFTVLSKYFSLHFLIEQLQIKLLDTSKGIDWNHMFCFISFIGMQYKDGWNNLKSLISVIIKVAFHNLDTKLLSYAFLIARQGCFEKSNSFFPSYLQWFSSTFSSESKRPLNSKKTCNLFFNFLSDLLPYDSTYYSKVHINRVPWVPNDCHSILYDYIELVKKQLTDLNISVELGICENTTNKSAAVFDVENVIKHFERTNEILCTLFQASMFCKDYYEKKFLVELLSKFDGKKSVRHKLILKLHSLGKIPNSLFKGYKTLEKKI